jgi:hypothetical protein
MCEPGVRPTRYIKQQYATHADTVWEKAWVNNKEGTADGCAPGAMWAKIEPGSLWVNHKQ